MNCQEGQVGNGFSLENRDLLQLRSLAHSYIKQGHYQTAIKILHPLLAIANHTEDLQLLGALYVQLEQPEKALEYLKQALERNPSDATSQLNLAKTFLASGDLVNAFHQANILKDNLNVLIAEQAKALLLAHAQILTPKEQ